MYHVYENIRPRGAYREVDNRICPTLMSAMGGGGNNIPLIVSDEMLKVYENHPQDSRVKEVDLCPSVVARYGTGGGNVPLVLNDQGGERVSIDHGISPTLRAQTHGHEPCVIDNKATAVQTAHTGANGSNIHEETAFTLESVSTPQAVHHKSIIRRLTPTECERLQGFPDNYTQIMYRNKPACDAPRYRALGNSMAVPCMKWIGEGIEQVQQMLDVIAQERCE